MVDITQNPTPAAIKGAHAIHETLFHPKSPDFLTLSGFEGLSEAKNIHLFCSIGSENQVLGYILFRAMADEAELLSLGVEKSHQNKGLAKSLMAEMITFLKGQGVKDLFLEVDEGNSAAIGLYRAFGAEIVGRRKGYYRKPDGTLSDALTKKITLR